MIYFLFMLRFTNKNMLKEQKLFVYLTNFMILIYSYFMIQIFGLVPYLIIQLSTITIGGCWGTFFFYIQYQFETVYWRRTNNWNFFDAAVLGSSHVVLPTWFD